MDNNINITLTPNTILLDVSPTIVAVIIFPTKSVSNHPNTNKHRIIDTINMILE